MDYGIVLVQTIYYNLESVFVTYNNLQTIFWDSFIRTIFTSLSDLELTKFDCTMKCFCIAKTKCNVILLYYLTLHKHTIMIMILNKQILLHTYKQPTWKHLILQCYVNVEPQLRKEHTFSIKMLTVHSFMQIETRNVCTTIGVTFNLFVIATNSCLCHKL